MTETEVYASAAIDDVVAERGRQVRRENWSHEHDDAHRRGELAYAGACYAVSAARAAEDGVVLRAAKTAIGALTGLKPPFALWPWDMAWWKPRSAREDLVRAAALIIAEIERIDRLPN